MATPFFDGFREAQTRLPEGLIRTGAPAPRAALDAAEARLGRPLPPEYRAFLESFDGADLFHESLTIAGVGPGSFQHLVEMNPEATPSRDLVFAEALDGRVFALTAAGAVVRLESDGEGDEESERMLAGSSFARWLDAWVAHEQPLYGPDGEFAPDAFDEEGDEVRPRVALKQADRALKHDPGAALWHHERGVALRRMERSGDALDAFERAAHLDPANGWLWFDLGRALLAANRAGAGAATAFRRAAEAAGTDAAQALAWAARAALASGDAAAADLARQEALALNPALPDHLRRAVDSARAEGDDEATAEAEALLESIDPSYRRPKRLPVLRPGGDKPAARTARTAPAASAGPPPRPRRPEAPRRPPREGTRRPARSPRAKKR